MSKPLPYIVGYAARFNVRSTDILTDPDTGKRFVEIVRPGAFDAALLARQNVIANVHHNNGMTPLGDTRDGSLVLSVDAHGLRYVITPRPSLAAEKAVQWVRDGTLRQASFWFDGLCRTKTDETQSPPVVELLSVGRLLDICICYRGAYSQTSVELVERRHTDRQERLNQLIQSIAGSPKAARAVSRSSANLLEIH